LLFFLAFLIVDVAAFEAAVLSAHTISKGTPLVWNRKLTLLLPQRASTALLLLLLPQRASTALLLLVLPQRTSTALLLVVLPQRASTALLLLVLPQRASTALLLLLLQGVVTALQQLLLLPPISTSCLSRVAIERGVHIKRSYPADIVFASFGFVHRTAPLTVCSAAEEAT
jgi:hypothetical protein